MNETKLINGIPYNEYQRQWREKNKEKAKATVQRWRDNHPEEWKAVQRKTRKKWQKNNPERHKELMNAAFKRYRAKHKDELYAKSKAYRKENIERIRKWRKANYYRHREEILKKLQERREADPNIQKIANKKHYDKYPEKMRHNAVVQRAKRGGARCYLTLDQWKDLMLKHNFLCFYCKIYLTVKNRSIDHLVPLSRGGTNNLSNLVPACRRCNSKKNDKTIDEYLLLRQ